MQEGAVVTATPSLLPAQVPGSPQVEVPQPTSALSGKKKHLVLTGGREGLHREGTSLAGQGGVDGGGERRSERSCAHRDHPPAQDELSQVATVGECSLCASHFTAFVL